MEKLTLARIVRDSALELLLTFCMLFGVTTIVRWVIGPSPVSRMIPQIQVELWAVGAAVAILIAGLIRSPAGRATGGHMNPGISFAMWRFGVFPGAGVVLCRCAVTRVRSGCYGSSRGFGVLSWPSRQWPTLCSSQGPVGRPQNCSSPRH
jgi:Major intrinsic protein